MVTWPTYRNVMEVWESQLKEWLDQYLNQDVRTTASPTHVGLTLSGLTVSQLVATDTNRILVSLARGNLTAGSSKVSIGGTGTGAVVGAGATVDVTEANLTHNNLGSLQGGQAGQYSHLTDAQISALHAVATIGGDPLSIIGQAISFNYNTTNFKITSNLLNTIQDIASTASPAFAGLTVDTTTICVDKVHHWLGIGTASPTAMVDLYFAGTAGMVFRANGGQAQMDLVTFRDSDAGGYLAMELTRGTIASPAVVQNNDRIGSIQAFGYSAAASTVQSMSQLNFYVDGNPDSAGDTTDMPCRASLWVTPDDSATSAEAWRVSQDRAVTFTGNIILAGNGNAAYPQDKLSVIGNLSVANDASVAEEKAANPNFTTVPDTNWTWGTGWAQDTTNEWAQHTAGNTAALEQNVTAVTNQVYKVLFTVGGCTIGSVTPAVGGVSGTAVARNVAGAVQYIRVTGTGNLTFTPTTNFDGYVDTVSVKQVTDGTIKTVGKIQTDANFNVAGTDGVTQAASAGKVSDVTALLGGIATAQTQITPIANGAHSLAGITSITTAGGRITVLS